jgi:uncharacterized delta-60 repeat protein
VVESLEGRWLLSAGDLDPTFGNAGLAQTGLLGSTADNATAVARDNSGRLVVAGSQALTGDVIVARYLAGGALDTSFGNGGKANIDFGGTDTANAVAVDGAGNIYLAGSRDTDMALARLTDQGVPDPTFGSGGVATAAGANDAASSIALSSSGIYIGGTSFDTGLSQNVFAVARFTTAGALDASFGGGEVRSAIGQGAQLNSLLADGSDVIAGGSSSLAGQTSFTVERFSGSGSVSWTEVTPFHAFDNSANVDSSIVSLANQGGRLLAIGNSDVVAFARYDLATGAPDVTFNTSDPSSPSTYVDASTSGALTARAGGVDGSARIVIGAEDLTVSQFAAARYTVGVSGPARDTGYNVSTDLGDSSHPHALKNASVGSDGSIVLVGDAFGSLQGSNMGGAIVDAGGAITGTFNTDFTGPTQDQGQASAIDSAGRIIVAGTQGNLLDDGLVQHIVIVRYTTSGAIDTTFGNDGVVTVDLGTRVDTFQGLALDANDNILVAGYDNLGDLKVARFIGGGGASAGSLDTSFAAGGTLTVDGVLFNDSDGAIRVAADGANVVVAGTTFAADQDFFVMRYTSSGAADATFNGGNLLTIDLRTAAGGPAVNDNDIAHAVLVLPDHSIVVGGSSTNFNDTGNIDLSLVRIDASGAVNAVAFQDVGGDGAINALALQDANVIAAGRSFDSAVVTRFDTTAGAFDSTFGVGGVATLDSLSTTGGVKGVAVDSQNNIGVVTVLDTASLDVVRLTSDGTLDSTFSGDGVAETDLTAEMDLNANLYAGIAVDASGNFVVTGAVGSPKRDIGVERFSSGFAVVINPTVTINGAPATSVEDTQISLTSTVTEGSAAIQTYAWSVTKNGNAFSSGSDSTFDFTPDAAGTYVVTLTVTAPDGGTDTDTATVNVTPAGVSASVVGGVLTINGDTTGNSVRVSRNSAGNYRVQIDSSVDQTFAFSSVNSILIQGGDGADNVLISSGISVPTETHGGGGNDILVGGGHGDMLFGEAGNDILLARGGNDILVGGDGNDYLDGGNGRDILIGGMGQDTIFGDSGEDILIAAYTSHDADPAALNNIRTVWAGNDTYANRVNTLKSTVLVPEINLFDDGVRDSLHGNDGRDWYIANITGGGVTDFIFDTQVQRQVITDI